MIFTSIIVSSLILLFFLNRWRRYLFWANFARMYGFIRLCEDEMGKEQKEAFWLLYDKQIKAQKWCFLLRGRAGMADMPEGLKPTAKIFDLSKYRQEKKTEQQQPTEPTIEDPKPGES